MKKILLTLLCVVLLSACSNGNKWEYKVVKVAGQDAEVMADYSPKVYSDQTPMLNKMGEDGWELIDVYTEVTTVHPNFGNSEYVTGIRENTRTSVLNFVFKRPFQKSKSKQ